MHLCVHFSTNCTSHSITLVLHCGYALRAGRWLLQLQQCQKHTQAIAHASLHLVAVQHLTRVCLTADAAYEVTIKQDATHVWQQHQKHVSGLLVGVQLT